MQNRMRTQLFCSFWLAVLAAGAAESTVLLTSPQVSSNRSFRFSFQSNAGQSYPIEVSTDMIRWLPLTNITGDGAVLQIEDNEAVNHAFRIYSVGIHPTLPIPVANMVFISPGTFTMGSPASESGRAASEGPQTIVTISRSFWMGKFEVTQEEYKAVMGSVNPFFPHPLLPVDFETWNNATNYCYKLTERERAAGRLPPDWIYRLPTEAEWEYAARAGKDTPFGIGDGTQFASSMANFDGGFPYGGASSGLFRNRTTIVGSFPPNAWGLYDMHGNVWEWCQDISGAYPGGSVTDPKGVETGSLRVIRGGGFTSVGSGCRSAKRDSRGATYVNFGYGFRVVLARDP